jgi:RNA polymerase sigma-70 factor, ECF subfamily
MISEKEYNDAVKGYARNIFRFVYRSLKDKEATEDLVQDCYMKLWQNRDKVDSLKIKPWLFSVAHHSLINYVKVEARKTGLDDLMINNMALENRPEFDVKDILEKRLNELNLLQKSIVLLRDLEGCSYVEIGSILNLTEAQVKVYLFRARLKLKDSLKSLNALL